MAGEITDATHWYECPVCRQFTRHDDGVCMWDARNPFSRLVRDLPEGRERIALHDPQLTLA